MELREAFVPFEHAEAPAILQATKAPPCIRVGFVSEQAELKRTMKKALGLDRIILTQITSMELIERAIEREIIDMAIVDIERQDEWPDSVFSRIDKLAAHFPIVLLCEKGQDVPSYIRKAEHLFFIFSHETISDPRFPNVIQAIQLKTDVVKSARADHGWGNVDDWLPPAA